MVAITQYYAKVGISTDMAQLKKVDRYLQLVEKKLVDFQKRLSKKNGALTVNFNFNTNRLQFDVQKAFNDVSRRVRFPVDNFVINKQNLVGQVSAAIRQAVGQANKNITLSPKVNKVSGGTSSATSGGGRSQSSLSRANFLHAGGAGGALARYGVGALPFVGGVYGLSTLNTANQDMTSAQISAQSVLGPEAQARMQWLMQRSDYLGVNYAETLPQFTKFMASASPLLGAQSSQDVFSSFMQFGRTRGATSVSMNRALNAVSQMGA